MLTLLTLSCNSPTPTSTPDMEDSSTPINSSDSETSEFKNLLQQYESTERVIWQKPEMIIALIMILKTKR